MIRKQYRIQFPKREGIEDKYFYPTFRERLAILFCKNILVTLVPESQWREYCKRMVAQ